MTKEWAQAQMNMIISYLDVLPDLDGTLHLFVALPRRKLRLSEPRRKRNPTKLRHFRTRFLYATRRR